MQPFREKLNSSFHKLGDKLKRARSSEAIDASADSKAKQPRTVRNPPSYSHLLLHPALHQKTLPPLHPANSPTATLTSGPPSTTRSLKFISPDPKPTGSASNPIDLTSSLRNTNIIGLAHPASPSMPSAPTAASDGENAGGMRHFQDPMDQVLEDSKLAFALQCEMTRESEQYTQMLATDDTVFDVDLHQYLTGLAQKKCSKCRIKVCVSGAHATARTKSMLTDESVLHPYVQCKKCRGWICMGCAAYSGQPSPPFIHSRSGDGFKVTWCCGHSRLFLIWSVACGTDFKKLPVKPQGSIPGIRYRLRSHSRTPKTDSQADSQADSQTTQEKGYLDAQSLAPVGDANKLPPAAGAIVEAARPRILGSLLPRGTGYGGYGGYNDTMAWYQKKMRGEATVSKPPPANQKEQDKKTQACLSVYFQAMNLLLPSWTGAESTPFDFSAEVSGLVSSMLTRSPLLPKASEVLRNDSMDELMEQIGLYSSVLDFIERMGNHPSTFPLLYRDLCLYRQEDQLVHISAEPSRLLGEVSAGFERAQGVLSVLGNLALHCQHFVHASSAHLEEYDTEDEEKALLLARRIVQVHEILETNRRAISSEEASTRDAARPRLSGDGEGTRRRTNATDKEENGDDVHQPLDQWHRLHGVAEVADERMLETHSFARAATQVSNEIPSLGRMKKLVAQVSGLRTSLPDGIYVRHCSSRLDVLKVLIAGPEGTPYENGLFEFDLFCPAAFPMQPPRMQFRTTGGGTVRFNPNLYQCGKVCLSLLGTWSGQKWTEQSTILQILVSVQAMIFTDKPWFNEPGRERSPDQVASQRYNYQVQGWTLQHAILYWLERRLSQPKSANKLPVGAPPLATKTPNGNKNSIPTAKPKKTQAAPPADLMNLHSLLGFAQAAEKVPAAKPWPPVFSPSAAKLWPFGIGIQPDAAAPSAPSNAENPSQDSSDKTKWPSTKLSFSQYLTHNIAALSTGAQNPPAPHLFPPMVPPLFAPNAATGAATSSFPPTVLHGSFTNSFPAELDMESLNGNFLPVMDEDEWEEFDEAEFEPMQPLVQANSAVPDTTARRKGDDDYIWGDVIRMHFKAKAKKILETAAEWRTTGKGKQPEDPIVQQLREAMTAHGFLGEA